MSLIAGPRRALLTPRALRGEKYVRSLSPAVWFRKGVGQTVTGAGVSQWDDQSGNARHLKQGTDTNRPALQADGTILFDGVDNFLKTDAFGAAIAAPYTIYILFAQLSWTLSDSIFDGNGVASNLLYQSATTPRIRLFDGTDTTENANLAVGSYGVAACVFSGAASSIRINNTTPTGGQVGVTALAAFTLGARGSGLANFGHIQVGEAAAFSGAHTNAQQDVIVRYFASVGSVELDS